MIAVLAANQPNPPTTSTIVNGAIYTRKDEPADYIIYDRGDGSVILTLDGYMICPMDMFTPRQVKMALKKYHAKA